MKILLCDLDGTVRKPISNNIFINSPTDQEIIPKARVAIQGAVASGFLVIGVTNQGGINAGYKNLKNCLLEQRITMQLLPLMSCIYAAIDDDECWCISQGPNWSFRFPTWLNLPWRYSIYKGMGENPKYNWLDGFRKPNPGMLQLAIAKEVLRKSDGLLGGIATAIEYVIQRRGDWEVYMTGDRIEDEQAAIAARTVGVEFIKLEDFYSGKFLKEAIA
ncbi:MAG: hypothetical protein QNJ46_05945 [Leptolyngbyaceae cyanobacterium MO_188.B28]|nr:hypothetical protein [Leptolyngbyaceae cyanobacterium MO_188.B28]